MKRVSKAFLLSSVVAVAVLAGLWALSSDKNLVWPVTGQPDITHPHPVAATGDVPVEPLSFVPAQVDSGSTARSRVAITMQDLQAIPDRVKTDLPLSVLLENAHQSVSRAEPDAALALYFRTLECENEDESLSYIAQRMNNQNGGVGEDLVDLGDGKVQVPRHELLKLEANGVLGIAARCDTPVRAGQSAIDWLRAAAEAGDPYAMYSFYSASISALARDPTLAVKSPETVMRLRADSERYLRASLASGNVHALREISRFFEEGIFVEQNRVAASAYLRALARTGEYAPASTIVNMIESGMSSEDLQAAQNLSERIYQNCCQR
jgi:TPR repeat protein